MANKIVLTRKEDDVVIFIVDSATEVENGLKVNVNGDEFIVGFANDCSVHIDVDVTQEIVAQEYKYSPSMGFVKNPNYVKPYIPEQAQKELEERVSLAEQALLAVLGV